MSDAAGGERDGRERSSGDPRLAAVISNWGPRMIANGVDYNDFVRATGSIGRWDDWLDAWTATGDRHLALAHEALARDRPLSAGEAFLRAAVSYHFAKFVWVLDVDRHRQATLAAVSFMRDAHELLDPTAQRIAVPLDGAEAVGNLRRPGGHDRAPVVILLPGLDSTKEEFWRWENVFLRRGMATFSFDGPGQGETGLIVPIRPDYEVAVTAAIDALGGSAGLNLDRLGAVGVSLGGYYVARAAAGDARLRAVAGVSGPFDLSAQWDSMPALTRETFTHHCGASTQLEARERAAELTLEGVAEQIQQPFLVITGRQDRVVPWEQTKRIADAAPNSEWVLYDEGTHVCNNIPFVYRPLIADWMREQLS
jgi:2,6-dihydroxypseudooxynicotine hydrolase